MTASRTIEPEWLDSLPGNDTGAVRSRRDIRRLNSLILHDRIVARELLRHMAGTPRRIVEIGAGDGVFMLSVSRRLAPRWCDVSITLLDRQDIVREETRQRFAALGWRAQPSVMDVFEFLEEAHELDAIIANLFLHHFRESDLARLFRHAAGLAPLFIACEPRRSFAALQASRLVWAIGCNRVTRHDAAASARAGFRGKELSHLWPKNEGWELYERPAGLFSHCFAARHAKL